MRRLRWPVWLFSLFTSLSVIFSGNLLKASAYQQFSGYLSVKDAVGSYVQVEYVTESGNQSSATATWYASEVIRYDEFPVDSPFYINYLHGFYNNPGCDCYKITLPEKLSLNQDVVIRVSQPFTVSNFTELWGFCSVVSKYQVSAAAYQSPETVVRYADGSSEVISSPSYSGVYPRIGSSAANTLPSWYHISSYDPTNVTFLEFRFHGCQVLDDDTLYIFFGYPCYYVPHGSGSIGTQTIPAATTTTPSSTSTTVSQSGGSSGSGSGEQINSELQQQTGILQYIKNWVDQFFVSIKNALISLFVPSAEFIADFKDDMADLLDDHLGGLYQAVSLLDDFIEGFSQVSTKQSIYIPPVSIPLAGSEFVLGDWTVPLKVTGLPAVLYDGLAFIIDFLCTAAFLRMCRNKLEIFLNPDSEVIPDGS